MTTIVVALRLVQLVCILLILVCIIMEVVARWENNHFIDDKGRRYKRTRSGFRYY